MEYPVEITVSSSLISRLLPLSSSSMHLLSLLALLLSLLYVIHACAPNAGVAPTPAPSGGDTGGDDGGGGEGDAGGGEEKRRRRSNVMRSSVEQLVHPLPDIHERHNFHARNDSIRVIVHDVRERE